MSLAFFAVCDLNDAAVLILHNYPNISHLQFCGRTMQELSACC